MLIYFSVSIYLSLSICLSLYLVISFNLNVYIFLCFSLSLSISLSLFIFGLSVFLFTCFSTSVTFSLSFPLSVSPFASLCLSVSLSRYFYLCPLYQKTVISLFLSALKNKQFSHLFFFSFPDKICQMFVWSKISFSRTGYHHHGVTPDVLECDDGTVFLEVTLELFWLRLDRFQRFGIYQNELER
jgi:hypothetical protein